MTVNLRHALAQIRAARNDPAKLALATLDFALAARGPELRLALDASAVPHWFDAQISGQSPRP